MPGHGTAHEEASDWLSVGDAARVLGMSRTTLLAAEDAGMISPYRTPGGHRRYSRAAVRQYLDRVGGSAGPEHDPALEASPVGTSHHRSELHRASGGGLDRHDLAATVRQALRPVVQALDGDSGGVYLLREDRLDFCAAFGVPRWLTERLAEAEPPQPVRQAARTHGVQIFRPVEIEFPGPRSTGHGLAMALRRDRQTVGALFLVTAREIISAELRIVEAFGDLICTVVEQQRQVADLERRLRRIAALCTD